MRIDRLDIMSLVLSLRDKSVQEVDEYCAANDIPDRIRKHLRFNSEIDAEYRNGMTALLERRDSLLMALNLKADGTK